MRNFSPIENRDDIGTINESAVLTELKFFQTANVELRFWRTKQGDKVDFIWIEDRVPVPIEVKSRVENDRVPPGLIKFMTNYPKSKHGYVINNHKSVDIEIDGKIIKYRKLTEIYEEFRGKDS